MGIYLSSDEVAGYSRRDLIAFLKAQAKKNANGLARFCLHESEAEALQLMIIALAPNITFPLHHHRKKTEYLVYLEGSGKITLNEGGQSSALSFDKQSARSGVLFLPKMRWHSVSSGREGLVFFEFAEGPFSPDDTVFAEAPFS
jgi:cupin fold WbuC family metalloprotein